MDFGTCSVAAAVALPAKQHVSLGKNLSAPSLAQLTGMSDSYRRSATSSSRREDAMRRIHSAAVALPTVPGSPAARVAGPHSAALSPIAGGTGAYRTGPGGHLHTTVRDRHGYDNYMAEAVLAMRSSSRSSQADPFDSGWRSPKVWAGRRKGVNTEYARSFIKTSGHLAVRNDT
mmetsp:Transcript_48711/g.80713  ORF Transcript_48711/g.80713 Transcript_48711/m.80713 type:complete len:174 (+) Transcript_48711:138-659(+)